MNWEAAQAVGEIVAATGVIVSLLYLAAQVRQSTRSTQAATSQELLSSYLGLISHSWQSEFGARLFHSVIAGDWDELNTHEHAAGRQFWVSAMRLFEHAYEQWKSGLLTATTWEGWRTQILLSSALRGFQDTWPAVRTMLSQDFVEWVDGLESQADSAAEGYREAMERGGLRVTTLRTNAPEGS